MRVGAVEPGCYRDDNSVTEEQRMGLVSGVPGTTASSTKAVI